MSPAPFLSILMPVRNEGVNVGIMVKILEAVLDSPHEVLIVYDNENDDTIPAVKLLQPKFPNVRLVANKLGKGVGNAIREGVSAAKGDCILIFAVDEVGPVLAIGDMLELFSQGCDFVSCTRYAFHGRRLGGSLVGGILSRIANYFFGVFSKCAFTDATTGIKMFRKQWFEKVKIESRPVGWAVAYELAIKAQLDGLKLGEVPIVSIDRLYGGESTFSAGPWMNEYLKWFFWGAKRLKNRPPVMVHLGKKIEVRS